MIGINLLGPDSGASARGVYGVDYIYPDAADLDYYAGKGVELLRLPVKWERLQPTLGGDLDSAELGRIETFLQEAHARGMEVILDLHNFGNYDGAAIGSAAVPIAAFAGAWAKIADALKDSPALWGYDLMNEPQGFSSATIWPAAAQAAVDSIRSVDTDHRIVVEGDGWSAAWAWQQTNANLILSDPADKLVYEAHAYFDAQSSGIYSDYELENAYADVGIDRVKPFVEWLEANHLHGLLGEFGIPNDDPRWVTVLENVANYLAQNNVDGTVWAGGPWFTDTPLSLEPVNGADRPQLAVIERYADDPALVIQGLAKVGETLSVSADGSNPVISTLVFRVAADSWNGDPQFNVVVDGRQLPGIFTASASFAANAWQDITVTGDFGPLGPTSVALNFINDGWGGSAATDRNLYVDSLKVNGVTFEGEAAANTAGADLAGAAALYTNGSLTFHTGASTVSTIVLRVSGDAWNGDPQFRVLVDGQDATGVLSTNASHAAGAWQDITVTGDFGPQGPDRVSVQFLNDGWGGTAATDRNLYVDSVTVNGKVYDGASAAGPSGTSPDGSVALFTNGSVDFATGTAASSTIVLRVAGDQWNGDPQFVVLFDGMQVGGAHSVDASYGNGEWQDIAITGDFGTGGPQKVAVRFINDDWGGSAAADRNLYVDSITVDGHVFQGESAVSGSGTVVAGAAALFSNDTLTFDTSATTTTHYAWERSFDQGMTWEAVGTDQPTYDLTAQDANARFKVAVTHPDLTVTTSIVTPEVIPENHAPTVTVADVSLATGDVVAAATLMQPFDPDGNSITYYQFWDGTDAAGSGSFLIGGIAQAPLHDLNVPASELSSTSFLAGSVSDDLWVRVSDGTAWSAWQEFHVLV